MKLKLKKYSSFFKEIYRVSCKWFLLKGILVSWYVISTLYIVFSTRSISEKIETQLIALIVLILCKALTSVIAPKFLFLKVRKQMQNLLNIKDVKIKESQFHCDVMYSWDVEKINKLKSNYETDNT